MLSFETSRFRRFLPKLAMQSVRLSITLYHLWMLITGIQGIQSSHGVWVDHMDLSSDRDHDKDYYDGLLDVTHGCYGITLSYNYLHDHWKAVLM